MLREQELKKEVLTIVKAERRLHPKIGSRKLHIRIKEHGIKIGRDRLIAILREAGMLIKPKRRYIVLTDSSHPYRKYENLLKERVVISREEVYLSDMTYIRSGERMLYLSLVMDRFTRKIVGYSLRRDQSSEGPLSAIKQAVGKVENPAGLIHHSDRGTQYCSNRYTEYLKEKEIEISMSRKGNPYDNAVMERTIGILKQEYGLGKKLKDEQTALKLIKESIELYNNYRLHKSLGYQTPAQRHAA